MHPEQIGWASVLVRLEMERGDLAAARQVIDQSLPRAGNSADFHSLAAVRWPASGATGRRGRVLSRSLAPETDEGRNWIGLGLALEGEGHAPEAREAFRRALQTEGLTPELQSLAERKTR